MQSRQSQSLTAPSCGAVRRTEGFPRVNAASVTLVVGAGWGCVTYTDKVDIEKQVRLLDHLLNDPATCESISGTDLLNFTCCHTETEAADQTFHLTQSQYTDTGPTSPSTDLITEIEAADQTLSLIQS